MNVKIDATWRDELAAEWEKPYFVTLTDFVRRQYSDRTHPVYPLQLRYLLHLMSVLSIRSKW